MSSKDSQNTSYKLRALFDPVGLASSVHSRDIPMLRQRPIYTTRDLISGPSVQRRRWIDGPVTSVISSSLDELGFSRTTYLLSHDAVIR